MLILEAENRYRFVSFLIDYDRCRCPLTPKTSETAAPNGAPRRLQLP